MAKKRTIIGYFLVLAAVLAVAAGASCELLPVGPSPVQVPPASTVTAPIQPLSDSGFISPLPDFVSVVAKVRPSVVAITTKVPGFSVFGGAFTQEGAGSGWIIDTNGVIVTNNHVVEDANSVSISLEDGRIFSAELIYTDPITDLAVIKIGAQGLPALRIGNSSKLRVGEWVVAIGNSLGMGISATKGIVSALGVSLPVSNEETLYDLIQTDAAINPGNSGGPLVNMAGEVVGINSAKVARVGVEAMGYAISIKEALPIIDQLMQKGSVVRPSLEARLLTVDQLLAIRYRLPVNRGVLVGQVVPDGAAARAGLRPNDIITSIGGREVGSVSDVATILQSYSAGQLVEVTFYRGNKVNSVTVILSQVA